MKITNEVIRNLKFGDCMKKPIKVKAVQMEQAFEVDTLEGIMKGEKGDYLMIGVSGEMYPCKKEIFEKTYDWV